jgi:hypothetical protein
MACAEAAINDSEAIQSDSMRNARMLYRDREMIAPVRGSERASRDENY